MSGRLKHIKKELLIFVSLFVSFWFTETTKWWRLNFVFYFTASLLRRSGSCRLEAIQLLPSISFLYWDIVLLHSLEDLASHYQPCGVIIFSWGGQYYTQPMLYNQLHYHINFFRKGLKTQTDLMWLRKACHEFLEKEISPLPKWLN